MIKMTDSIITGKDILKVYDDFRLGELSFKIPKDSIVGIIGENGAGKSTLLKMILGLTEVESGDICVFDINSKDLRHDSNRHVFDSISAILDENFLPEDLTANQMDLIMDDIYTKWDRDLFEDYIHQFNIQGDKRITNYSKGMKMKLALAVSLSHDSKLFILDEPTTGLDPISRKEILDIFLDLKNNNATILFSTHITSDIERVADYIMFLHQGDIAFFLHRSDIIGNYNLISGERKLIEEYIPNCSKHREVGDRVEILLNKKYDVDSDSITVRSASLDDVLQFYI